MPASKALRISIVGLRGVVGSGMTAAHVMEFAPGAPLLRASERPVLGPPFRENRSDGRSPNGNRSRLTGCTLVCTMATR